MSKPVWGIGLKRMRIQRFLCVALTVSLMLVGVSVGMAPQIMAATEGGFTYQVYSDGVWITDCDESYVGGLIIPTVLGGRNVIGLETAAFSNCREITSVVIPDSITKFGGSVFAKCTSLEKVVLPQGMTATPQYMFNGCTSLMSVTIPDSVTCIGQSTFSGCTALTDMDLPDGITTIGPMAFKGCSGLLTLELPNELTKIEHSAFFGCSALTSVTIPAKVKSVGTSAFYECTALKEVYLDAVSCGTMGDDFTSSFWNCHNLEAVYIGSGVQEVPDFAFYNCLSLKSVTLPQGLVTIGKKAFAGTGITSVSIPVTVTAIESYAFDNCENLADVYYYGTSQQWQDMAIGEYNDSLNNAEMHDIQDMCTHSWKPATCTNPAVCTLCLKEKGIPLGHLWQGATCTSPGTCLDCGLADGRRLPHKVQNGVCSLCDFVLGDANDDKVLDAKDSVYLLYHILLPEEYPLAQSGDWDRNAVVDEHDAVYLLYCVLLPEQYPIQ